MKITKVEIHNVGKIADTTITVDKPLILFYGQVREGKSTILKAIGWAFGGKFPSDIIRHGESNAHVEFSFDGGFIRREWYKGKDGTTKSREIEFVRNGRPVNKPVSEIERLLNPFLLNQNHLLNMSELERKAYFTDLFQVDTKDLDTELFTAAREASDLRAKIKGYGEIDLIPQARVDIEAIKAEMDKLVRQSKEKGALIDAKIAECAKKHHEEVVKISDFNATARDNSIRRGIWLEKIEEDKRAIADLLSRVKELQDTIVEREKWLQANPDLPELSIPIESSEIVMLREERGKAYNVDTSAFQTKISDGKVQNMRAEQYEANVKRAEARAKDEERLKELEQRQRDIKTEKASKLASVAGTCGIKDLAFDEEGNLLFEQTQAGMLSTSQIMRLSSAISDLYPEGFGLDLIDRGESLGKSIFDLVQRAKDEEKSILATVVGERPATIPAEIGVFVVEDGKVSQ